MHRGILLSFYSSAAGFVNGKCACFLPGFLGRAQKSPGRGRTIWNARRVCCAHKQRKNYSKFAMPEDLWIFRHCLFTGRGDQRA